MNSIVWKCGSIGVFFALLQCGNGTSSTSATLHPLMNLELIKQDTTSQVLITTTLPKVHSYFRIVDACTLQVSYHKVIDGLDSAVVESVAVANDSAAFQSGTFSGSWVIPNSLSFDSLVSNTPLQIYGFLSDETNHVLSGSLTLYDTASPPSP
jgi:hypothetical protein